MTDMALSGVRTIDLASDAARARVRARYRAEARFKIYGLLAIGLTALFLVLVLTDIVIKGLPAFTQHSAGARRHVLRVGYRSARHPRSAGAAQRRLSRRWCATPCAPSSPMSPSRTDRRAARRPRVVRRRGPPARPGRGRSVADRKDRHGAAAAVGRRRPLLQGSEPRSSAAPAPARPRSAARPATSRSRPPPPTSPPTCPSSSKACRCKARGLAHARPSACACSRVPPRRRRRVLKRTRRDRVDSGGPAGARNGHQGIRNADAARRGDEQAGGRAAGAFRCERRRREARRGGAEPAGRQSTAASSR